MWRGGGHVVTFRHLWCVKYFLALFGLFGRLLCRMFQLVVYVCGRGMNEDGVDRFRVCWS